MTYQVLIADDYRMIRQMFEEMLKSAGDRYSLAGTAENADICGGTVVGEETGNIAVIGIGVTVPEGAVIKAGQQYEG